MEITWKNATLDTVDGSEIRRITGPTTWDVFETLRRICSHQQVIR